MTEQEKIIPEGQTYNEALKSIMDRNNHFLLRINDAMIRIANGSILKELLEQVESQREPIKTLNETRSAFGVSLDKIGSNGIEILAMSRQARNSIEPGRKLAVTGSEELICAKENISGILEKADALKKIIKESDSTQQNNEEILKYLDEIAQLCEGTEKTLDSAAKNIKRAGECIGNIINQIKIISDDMKDIYAELGDQTMRTDIFLKNVDSISGSYEALYMQCFNLGKHLYRISRDIDNARNDMYRQNSKPTMHDALKIFDVDHLTLTWRLYNNIIEYETLKITQLNNPDRCKFGLWWRSQTDPKITQSEEFKLVFDTHEILHKHAVSCFLAKEASNTQEAMDEFILALDAYNSFHDALDKMHEYLRKTGITEETEVWVYKG